jgi:hypothetical protein
MPKFMTYQRPAPVSKQSWNHAPDRKAEIPKKAPEQQKPQGAGALPALDQLLRK